MRTMAFMRLMGEASLLLVAGGCVQVVGEDSSSLEGPSDWTGDADGSYCSPVAHWSQDWTAFEDEVLELVNRQREKGTSCGVKGSFGPAAPLVMDEALRCAARVHSRDMAVNDYFDHISPDGETPWERFELAGYSFVEAGENIAAGYPTPEKVVRAWLGSDGHCAILMSSSFDDTGVGFYMGDGTYWYYWTQAFASPE